MSRDEIVDRIKSALAERILDLQRPLDHRVQIDVDSSHITDVAELMFRDLEARLQTASGIDGPKDIEILYHWALDRFGMIVTVRTSVDRAHPEIASIVSKCPAAEWIERELWELLGIQFAGHPDLRHLLLKDDWPAGNYPLRRDSRKE